MFEIRYLKYVGRHSAPRVVTYMKVPDFTIEVFLHLQHTIVNQGNRLWFLYHTEWQQSGPLIYCEPSASKAVAMLKQAAEPNRFLVVGGSTRIQDTVSWNDFKALICFGEIRDGYVCHPNKQDVHGTGKFQYASLLDTGHVRYAV